MSICSVCEQIEEEYECCKIQCCSKKSSESIESLDYNICCKSEKVSNASKTRKPYSYKKQHKAIDRLYSSNLQGRRKSNETNKTIHIKLACIIKRLNHLIETCPIRNDTSKNCSAKDRPTTSMSAVANPQNGIICASKSTCKIEQVKNECEKQPQENVIPAVYKTCTMPAFNDTFSLPETRSPNDCLTVVQHGVTIGYIMYSKIDPCEVKCSKSSCNIEPAKNDCEDTTQEPVIPVDTCCSASPVKCPSETKVLHNSTQSLTRIPVDIPCSRQNLITPVTDCSKEKSCSEWCSIDLCPEVEAEKQKEDCTVDGKDNKDGDNNCNDIKDDETNKNIGTKDPEKPKPPPVPVKTIKSIGKNIIKPKTSSKQNPGNFKDEIKPKVKPNSKHNKLTIKDKKNINKR
ncbi:unnamed protein product [Macrosiphum euphorbiae]|nr:unnamed protein product [Macrosiphum euphorbiae]